ncbi:MAG: hypothetical protein KatS3mg103_0938 [Phycisphaerales bacterium]|nr:MAG: hypothetical protein KatS3mg103_0938 [Phycisphaerales bacterium]
MTAPAQASQGSIRRTAVGLVALAALWNAVYWLWPVHRQAPVVIATAGQPQGGRADPSAQADPPGRYGPDQVVEPAKDSERARADGAPPAEPPRIIDPMLHDPAEAARFVVPPAFRPYTITEQDTSLQALAERVLGDASLADAIARSNPLKDPRRLSVGEVWMIPVDPANIQGQTVDAQGNPVLAPLPKPPPVPYTEYVVQKGDTLGQISKLHYKTTRHAQAIFEFNRHRLKLASPRAIRPGQVLHIPKDPP